MNTISRLVGILLVAFSLCAFTGRASAPKPYAASGGAQFVSQNDFVGSGHATHLGAYTEVGNVSFAPTSNPDVLAITGWARYTAASGAELHATLTGELNTATGAITATVTYTGGTGRFSNASGSSTLTGQMLGGGGVTVSVAGSISY